MQGLEKYYSDQRKYDKLAKVIETEANLYLKSDDASKCAEQLQKLLRLRREHGGREKVRAPAAHLADATARRCFVAILADVPLLSAPVDAACPRSECAYRVFDA